MQIASSGFLNDDNMIFTSLFIYIFPQGGYPFLITISV